MIRALRLTDLVDVAMFLRRTDQLELTSHTWPKVQPESGHLPLGIAVTQSFGLSGGGEQAWLSRPERVVDGLMVARPRCGGLVWDIQHLLTAGGESRIAEELLDVESIDADRLKELLAGALAPASSSPVDFSGSIEASLN